MASHFNVNGNFYEETFVFKPNVKSLKKNQFINSLLPL